MYERESVQFFQFDYEGNMFVFEPGAGCSGPSTLVKPGDELIFNKENSQMQVFSDRKCAVSCNGTLKSEVSVRADSEIANSASVSKCQQFNEPLKTEELEDLNRKKFAPETHKKINWVTKMYRDWRNFRASCESLENIECDLNDVMTITEENAIYTLVCFLTEVKKLDGSDFPPRTLYDILICVQFHLENLGFGWRLLIDDTFKNVKFTLDNLMKLRTSQGLGTTVKKAQVLMPFDEDLLWSLGLLGSQNPEVLLNTIVFVLGKGCALHVAKEHYALRAPPFRSQVEFLRDDEGQVFLRYKEEIGFKTSKGGLKHRKREPKEVDIYPVENAERGPLRLFLKYLSVLPFNRNCTSLYLQPRKKYRPDFWYQDRPAGKNRLRDVVKDMCKKAGFPGFYSNHSLRGTAATRMYRCNIDEQLIQEITGHRSLAVHAYRRTSSNQRKIASNCIFNQ